MGVEPGGRADKLGNEYERLWVVKQILRVLGGEAKSILWEALGPHEKGVDVWVWDKDNMRTGYQCKRENGSKHKWTICDLNREKVLENVRFQLDESPSHRFAFVSSDPVEFLDDMVERTSRCNNDPEEFVKYSVATSRPLKQAFEELCNYARFDVDTPVGRSKVYDFLSRFRAVRFAYGREGQEDVRILARYAVREEAETVVATLEKYANDNIGVEIYFDNIRDYLCENGFHLRDLGGDPQLHNNIERLQERFKNSIESFLIRNKLIPRPEATGIFDRLKAERNVGVFCIHGRAGYGKSGVLLEVVRKLDNEQIPYLPIRLDSLVPSRSSEYFGREVCGLPSSPAACLKAVAGGRMGVLILDQLDAIRWTAANNPDAWEACREVLNEAVACPNISTVLACRTFDWNDSPLFRLWKEQHRAEEIKVGELAEGKVEEIVVGLNGEWSKFTTNQKRLLQSPQHLYLWTILQETGRPFTFGNASDLMRCYWKDLWANRLCQLSVSANDCKRLIDTVVVYMDRNSKLTAPQTLVGHFQAACKAFCSLDIWYVREGQIKFSHQSHLDYLVAERLLQQVHRGSGSIIGWLLENEQSLFRRDQLRQMLTLLRDGARAAYLKAIKEIIRNDKIRFHLKHLVLTFLGLCETPSEEEQEYVISLVENAEWGDIVTDYVLWNKPPWFEAMADRGIVDGWLCSSDERKVNMAINMMYLVKNSSGKTIAKILRAYERKPDPWPERIKRVLLYSDFSEISRELCALHIRLMRRGELIPEHVDWRELGRKRPKMCILLLKVIVAHAIKTYQNLSPDSDSFGLPEFKSVGWYNVQEISEAAKEVPGYAWKTLVSLLMSRHAAIASIMQRFYPYSGGYYDREILYNKTSLDLSEILLALKRILVAAGCELAKSGDKSFDVDVRLSFGHFPKLIQRAIMESIAGYADSYANTAIDLLCDYPVSLELGDRSDPSKWETARKVIERFSPHCSEKALQRIEKTVLAYKEPDLKKSVELQKGLLEKYNLITCTEFGQAQQVLLRAIPKQRLSKDAAEFLAQLDRKFGPEPYDRRPEHRGGWVGSTIPHEGITKLSDRQWLKIIKSEWAPRGRHWKQMGPDHLGEASHEHFARDVGTVAKREPKRFAKLALQIPKDAYHGYFYHILQALAETKATDAQEPATWQAASKADIEPVLDHLGYSENESIGQSYCWLIDKRKDIDWSAKALQRLAQYAIEHPHPAPDEFPVHSSRGPSGKMEPDIQSSAINCVRGCAANAIKRLLFDRKDLFDMFQPAIEHLVKDPSPAVRVAAVGTCLPILNIDKDIAVEYFCEACEISDERVLRTHEVSNFINYARHSHLAKMIPYIETMARSKDSDLATSGASWVAAIWLEFRKMRKLKEACGVPKATPNESLRDLLGRYTRVVRIWFKIRCLMRLCRIGNTAQRKGVADLSARWIKHEEVSKQCAGLLEGYFNDEEKDVRHKAATCFYQEEILNRAGIIDLTFKYVNSKSFADGPDMFFYHLEKTVDDVRPSAKMLLRAGEIFAGPLAEASRDLSRGVAIDARSYAKLLLRLYGQCERESDKELQKKCLDIWDMLLRARAGGLYSIFEEVEK